jgi:Tfp pilus assembly protein PilF
MNAVFHACWSSPPQKSWPSQTAERKGVASREVAEFYLDRGNYHAAESRFREALEYNPNDARAMFELAQCLEKMNHTDAALEEYRSCAQ